MALYTERKYSDIAADWEAIQRQQAQRQQEEALNRYNAVQNKVNQAQQGASNPLESVLSGIGNSIKNVGTGLMDLFGTGGAAIGDAIQSIKTGKVTTKNQDDYRKWLYNTDSVKDAATKGLGTGLDAAATLTDFIPGLGAGTKVALNVGQGIASGAANPLIEKGSQATLEDAMKGALVGGASAGVGQYVGGKLANRAAGKGIVSKALNSNIGKAAITGGLAGATGGGLYAGLNGGDVIGGALQGAQGGALAGGTMAGTMGLIGTGLNKLNNRVNPQAGVDTPTTTNIAQNIAEDVPETPRTRVTASDAEPVSTRRKIDVQYVDDNDGAVNVGRNRGQYRLDDRAGSTLDGILGPNNKRKLPNATVDQKGQFNRAFKDNDINNMSDVIRSGALDVEGDDALAKQGVLREILGDEVYNKLREGTREYADIQNSGFEGTLAGNKSELPKLNRQQYYEDTIGKLGKNGNAGLRAADVPEYMQGHLSNDAGKNNLGGAASDNASILRELFGQEGDLGEMYKRYEDLAQSQNQNVTYTNDNALGALAMDPNLNAAVTEKFLADSYPTRKIDVDKQLPLGEQIDVNSPNRGQLIQDIMPTQRRQAQPQVQAQATQEAPMPAQRIRRAADTSDIKINSNLDPADVARLERQLTVNRQKQGAALLDQYGTLDKPVRRAVGAPEDVLATLYDNYGLKTPADVQYAANHVTGRDGVVSKMTRELAASADNVDTTITRDWLQELMDNNGLLDDEQKTVTKQITGALKRANTNSDGATTLDIMKQLEKQSARYKGKDGTYHNSTDSDVRKGIILDLVHDELQDRLWDAAGDPKKVLTPKRITELKNMYKGNDTWADFIDNKLAKSRSGAELRSHMKPLVDGSKIVYGSKMSAGGFADNSTKRLLASGHPFQAVGQMAVDRFQGSDKAKQARADRYAKEAAKAQAQLTGQEPVKTTSGLKGIGQKALDKAGKVATMFNNDTVYNARFGGNVGDAYNMPSQGEFMTRQLSRQAGIGAMRDQDRQAEIQSGLQEMQNIQNDYENALLQSQQAQQAYAQAMRQRQAPSTLDRIGAGMERALAAGDINAYSTLADLYKQALQIQQLQNPTSSSQPKALSANQSKALTGLQQLQTLASMTPDLGTALSNSPLGGVVDLLGGNDYANQAKSLALTLGYLQSGANITPREAENIGKSYIPTAYDSENVRQQKLSRAEQLLRNYLADTGSLETAQ